MKRESSLLESIAGYGARDATRELPEEVVHHAKRAVIDWLAALYPGTRVSPALNLVKAHKAELGLGRSSLPGFSTTAFPALAAWINGSAAHSVEFDDIFRDAVYHPGCPVIAAALALAEDRRRAGHELINAITVGYEISTRIGTAVQPSHYTFFHTTASVGVQSAMAAANGVTGATDILEGDAGFGAAMSDGANWERALAGLGERYNITRMTQKNHGCCGHAFAAIDAALELRARGVTAADVERVEVASYRAALEVAGIRDPRSAAEAKFSIPYLIAHALLHGSVRLNAFEDERLGDPALRALLRKVEVREDPALTAGFPHQRAARVTITTRDGRKHGHFAPYRKGDPEAPLSDADIHAKFRELVEPVLGVTRTYDMLQMLWNLENILLPSLELSR